MLRDYAEYSQRVMTALQSFEGGLAPQAGAQGARERDTLMFPNVFGFPAWQLPPIGGTQRNEKDRAA